MQLARLGSLVLLGELLDLLEQELVAFLFDANDPLDEALSLSLADPPEPIGRARDVNLPGRYLKGIYMALDYLRGVTESLLASRFRDGQYIHVQGKDVVVIGAGDTGTDCIGTALRHGCRSLINISRREREPVERDQFHDWPGPPGTYYLDYAQVEGRACFGCDPFAHEVVASNELRAIFMMTVNYCLFSLV